MEEETTELDLSTDTKKKEALLSVMKEISHELHAIETSRDQIKEIIAAANSTFGLNKGLIRKVSKFYHNKRIKEFENEASEIKNLYSQLTTK
jgi:DNA gyrase/topoisomerase IV subunit A